MHVVHVGCMAHARLDKLPTVRIKSIQDSPWQASRRPYVYSQGGVLGAVLDACVDMLVISLVS